MERQMINVKVERIPVATKRRNFRALRRSSRVSGRCRNCMCDNDVRRARNIILSRQGIPNGCSNRIPTQIAAAAVAPDNWRVYLRRRRSGNTPNRNQNYCIKVKDDNQNVWRASPSYLISSVAANMERVHEAWEPRANLRGTRVHFFSPPTNFIPEYVR